MYDLRPYVELTAEVATPESIMYKLESIHRRLSESFDHHTTPSQNGSRCAPSVASPAPMVNGHTAPVSLSNGSATSEEVAAIELRQQSVIKRIEQLRTKLDSMLITQPSGTEKNEKTKSKGGKKKEEKSSSPPVACEKSVASSGAAPASTEKPLKTLSQSIGQSVAACAPPTLLDFDNSSASVAELLAADKKIDVALSIGADDSNWASALLNVLTSRQKDITVRSFKHSTHSGATVPSLTERPFDESASISITVVVKSGDGVGPSVSLGARKHGPVAGYTAVWKLLGRLAGLYPMESAASAVTATRIDFWLTKAANLAHGDAKTKALTEREMSAFLGRCDFLGAAEGLSLADVVIYGLLCHDKDNRASNLESWLARCRAVGMKSCCC